MELLPEREQLELDRASPSGTEIHLASRSSDFSLREQLKVSPDAIKFVPFRDKSVGPFLQNELPAVSCIFFTMHRLHSYTGDGGSLLIDKSRIKMKKLILGIIAVFLIEIGFITFLNLDTSTVPAVAVINIDAPGRDPGILDQRNDVLASAGPDVRADSGAEPRRAKLKIAKAASSVRRPTRRIRPAMGLHQLLSVRAVPNRSRVRMAPRPGFRTEVHREYFGRMVVEVTYLVYDFRPRNNSTTRKGQYIA